MLTQFLLRELSRINQQYRCFVPAFEKKWKNYERPVGSSWRVDETYIKVKGQWRYLFRAVDKQGQTVDFLLSKNRDKAAAVRFFKKAIGNHEVPVKITLDGSLASHQAVAELKAEGVLPAQTLVRASKYLNYVANSVMWRPATIRRSLLLFGLLERHITMGFRVTAKKPSNPDPGSTALPASFPPLRRLQALWPSFPDLLRRKCWLCSARRDRARPGSY
jgi:hypothetical protein